MSVLDASAVIAWLVGEPGHEVVQAALDSGQARISSVNLAEILTYIQGAGHDLGEVARDLQLAGVETVPFSAAQAQGAAELRGQMRAFGLSLGDRACLTLARELGVPALTADRAWTQVQAVLGVQITLIRV